MVIVRRTYTGLPSNRIKLHIRSSLIQSLEHRRRPSSRILFAYIRPMNEKYIRLFCKGGNRQQKCHNYCCTWVRENLPELPMLSLDEIRAELAVSPRENQAKVAELAQARARQLLREKKSFVWNATDLTVLTRQGLVGLFTDYGAAVELVYLETEEAQRKKRNAERSRQVPEEAVSHMLEQLVLPEQREAHRVRWLCV